MVSVTARQQASLSLLCGSSPCGEGMGILLKKKLKQREHHNPLPVNYTIHYKKALNLQCMYLTKEVVRLLPQLGTSYMYL